MTRRRGQVAEMPLNFAFPVPGTHHDGARSDTMSQLDIAVTIPTTKERVNPGGVPGSRSALRFGLRHAQASSPFADNSTARRYASSFGSAGH